MSMLPSVVRDFYYWIYIFKQGIRIPKWSHSRIIPRSVSIRLWGHMTFFFSVRLFKHVGKVWCARLKKPRVRKRCDMVQYQINVMINKVFCYTYLWGSNLNHAICLDDINASYRVVNSRDRGRRFRSRWAGWFLHAQIDTEKVIVYFIDHQ